MNDYVASGFVTSGGTNIFVNVETPKLLDNITESTVASLSGGLRGPNGYVDGTGDSTNLKNAYAVTAEITGRKSMRLKIAKSSAFSNIDNNTPVTVPLSGTITLR